MRISDWSSDVCSSDLSVDPMTRKVRAPASLLDGLPTRIDVEAVELGSAPDASTEDRMRLLHAKCIRYESHKWTAAMVGSDRKSVVSGKSVSVRVDLGGSGVIKKKNQKQIE